jgi:hypothetical protein
MVHYGFCLEDNIYDSYPVDIRIDIDFMCPFLIPVMVDFTSFEKKEKQAMALTIRLKTDILCNALLDYLRLGLEKRFRALYPRD